MTQSGEPSPTQRDAVLDGLMKSLDSPARAANKALVRWLVSTDPPLMATCILFTLEPPNAPLGVREVADSIGITVDEAAQGLRELRSLGYVREAGRRYEATDAGLRLHASLSGARREALAAFLRSTGDEELRELAEASEQFRSRQP
jgi:hypothetical protein